MVFDYPDKVNLPSYRPTYRGNAKQIRAAVQRMQRAERPVLYVGGGVVSSGAADELVELADALQLPVVTTLMGKGAFPASNPLNIGPVGMHGSKYANLAMTESRLDHRLRRALLRPRDGQALRVRPACRRHPYRYRPGRDRQDPQGADPHRRRPSRRARRHQRGGSQGRRQAHHRTTGSRRSPSGAVASRSTTPTWWEDPRLHRAGDGHAEALAQARPRAFHRGHRGRPASDVGCAVHRSREAAHVHLLRRPGHHGIRLPGGHRRGLRLPGRPGGLRCRRRLVPDELSGNGHGRHQRRAGEGAHPGQPRPRHGAPVAEAVLQRALQLHGAVGQPRLLQAGRCLQLEVAPHHRPRGRRRRA